METLIEQGPLLNTIASSGIQGAHTQLGVELSQLQNLVSLGEQEGRATDTEWRTIIAGLAIEFLNVQRDDSEVTVERYLSAMQVVRDFMAGQTSIIPFEEGSFSDVSEGEDIPKFNSGFDALDKVTAGLYQGLTIFMGAPGQGKTAHMLTLASYMKRTDPNTSVHFYQTEIPQSMFQYRIKPLTQITPFDTRDKIFYGIRPMSEVIDRVMRDPDPNRIVMYDSPDVLAKSDERRFELESIYRDLVILKGFCKMVVCASQPRRNDTRLKMTSVSDSWAKAWYADIIIGIQRLGMKDAQSGLFRMASLKNRFGPPDLEIKYIYDLINLTAVTDERGMTNSSGWDLDEDF